MVPGNDRWCPSETDDSHVKEAKEHVEDRERYRQCHEESRHLTGSDVTVTAESVVYLRNVQPRKGGVG